jgi:NADH dehydrogenase
MDREERPRVVIVGAGFGGLWAARALAGGDFDVRLVDRNNYHTFLPLLYQVGAAELEAEGIARPVRGVVRRWAGVRFVLAEARQIDVERRLLLTDGPLLPYDYLVVATGSVTHFFGVPGAAEHAFELKSLRQGVALRSHILGCFEEAALTPEAAARRRLLNFVIVGGGATGVEFAGALAELVQRPLRRDYPELDFGEVRVTLLEAGPSLLPYFPPRLSDYAAARLRRMGVEVRLAAPVAEVSADGALLPDGELIPSASVVWTAGVRGDPLAAALGLPVEKDGRVPVLPTLQVAGHPEIYVIGDLARAEEGGRPLPMVAPAATQEGTAASANIRRQHAGAPTLPFRYRDKGTMVTIGRHAAVAQIGRWSSTGLLAWWLWLAVHFAKLIGFRNRLLVLLNWAWDYLFFERAVRLIVPRLGPEPGAAAAEAEESAEGELARAVAQFNAGEYFACHETLEELWLAAPEPERRLYQGILQIAAALLHRERGNHAGAMTLLASGTELLQPFLPTARGLDLARLAADAARLRQALAELGPERMGEVDRALIPRLREVAGPCGDARAT